MKVGNCGKGVEGITVLYNRRGGALVVVSLSNYQPVRAPPLTHICDMCPCYNSIVSNGQPTIMAANRHITRNLQKPMGNGNLKRRTKERTGRDAAMSVYEGKDD